MSTTKQKIAKDQAALVRAYLNREADHIRCGTWSSLDDTEITLVGHARDLHGTVCTCCPRREEAGAA